jgi:hypothetical protein
MKDSKFLILVIGYCVIIATCFLLYFDKTSIFDRFTRFQLIKQKVFDGSCGRFPTDEHVTIDNLYWQVLQTPNGFVNLYNAYLDLRQNKSVVRINVLAREAKLTTDQLYCQLWSDETKAATAVRPSEVLLMWSEFESSFV